MLNDSSTEFFKEESSEPTDLKLELSANFNFLVVAQWGPRKNIENTILWFVEEFIDNEDVGLVLKVSTRNNSKIDRFHTEKNLGIEDTCPICIFEKTTVFFIDFNLAFSIFVILLFLFYKIFFQENTNRVFLFFHQPGQRAPPR